MVRVRGEWRRGLKIDGKGRNREGVEEKRKGEERIKINKEKERRENDRKREGVETSLPITLHSFSFSFPLLNLCFMLRITPLSRACIVTVCFSLPYLFPPVTFPCCTSD